MCVWQERGYNGVRLRFGAYLKWAQPVPQSRSFVHRIPADILSRTVYPSRRRASAST